MSLEQEIKLMVDVLENPRHLDEHEQLYNLMFQDLSKRYGCSRSVYAAYLNEYSLRIDDNLGDC